MSVAYTLLTPHKTTRLVSPPNSPSQSVVDVFYGIMFGSCDGPVAYFGLHTQPLSTST